MFNQVINPFFQSDHPYYTDPDRVLVTRDRKVVATLPCERILLPRERRWPTHHIGGHLSRTGDGHLHTLVSGAPAAMRWVSEDEGHTWTGKNLDLEGVGAFTVLEDGGFITAVGGGTDPIRILRSSDRGQTWEDIAEIPPDPFDALHIDSNLLQLHDGALLLAANMRLDPPPGESFDRGQYPQYLFRSSDGGHTWRSGIDSDFWEAVRAGKTSVPHDGPHCTWPGEGGTFPGVYETGFCQLADQRLLGAFRFSGPPLPWHHRLIDQWGEPPAQPDAHGRIFRHVVLGESRDGGRSWRDLRPVLDDAGAPLMLIRMDPRLKPVGMTAFLYEYSVKQNMGII